MKLHELTGVLPDPPAASECADLVTSNRKIGVEFEIEGIPSKHLSNLSKFPLLRQVSEGSLRGGGAEIVTVPVKGTQIIEALYQFNQWIGEAKGANCSERTGLHVHVDFRDASTKQLIRLIVSYLVVEELLFGYCGIRRKDNPYCVPLSDLVASRQSLNYLLYPKKEYVFEAIDRHAKYTALNIHPLLSLGTVEFRIHPGTSDTEQALAWVNIVLGLVDFAISTKKTPQEIIDLVCLDPEELITEVFSGHLTPLPDDWHHLLLVGARMAQEFYRYKEENLTRKENNLLEKLYGTGKKTSKRSDNNSVLTPFDDVESLLMETSPPGRAFAATLQAARFRTGTRRNG